MIYFPTWWNHWNDSPYFEYWWTNEFGGIVELLKRLLDSVEGAREKLHSTGHIKLRFVEEGVTYEATIERVDTRRRISIESVEMVDSEDD